MSASFRISPDVAWVEGEAGGLSEQVVWVSNLETGVQYELTGTGWLIWVLIADGFGQPAQLHTELEHIRANSGQADAAPVIDPHVLHDFLTGLEHDGLLTSTNPQTRD